MMTADSREGYEAKQEGATINIDKFSKEVPSRQWPGFRNPRIVRVSRSFGGKDRHSKVCTIRGLRDRRIRLSVPTALQLYDLQDRLGLTQPSKVIDWLLEATKYDIDNLPPLQIPQGFAQFHHQTLLPHHDSIALQSSLGPLYDAHNSIGNLNLMTKPRFWDTDAISRLKGKEDHERGSNSEKGKWIKTSEEENEDGIVGCRSHSQVSAQKLFPSWAHSSLPGLLNNAMAYNNPYHSEPSSLSLSQFGSHGLLFPSQVDPHHPSSGGTSVQFSSSLPVVPSGSQLVFCPSSATPSFFNPNYNPQNNVATSAESHDPRQLNQIQFLSSSSQVVLPPHPHISCLHPLNSPLIKPLPSPFSAKLLDSDHNNEESGRS